MPAPIVIGKNHRAPGLGRQARRAVGVPLKPVQRFVTDQDHTTKITRQARKIIRPVSATTGALQGLPSAADEPDGHHREGGCQCSEGRTGDRLEVPEAVRWLVAEPVCVVVE
jgi:hypothetical protein